MRLKKTITMIASIGLLAAAMSTALVTGASARTLPHDAPMSSVRIVVTAPSGAGTYTFASNLGTFRLTPGRNGVDSTRFEVSGGSTITVTETGAPTALKAILCAGDVQDTSDLATATMTSVIGHRHGTVLTFVN